MFDTIYVHTVDRLLKGTYMIYWSVSGWREKLSAISRRISFCGLDQFLNYFCPWRQSQREGMLAVIKSFGRGLIITPWIILVNALTPGQARRLCRSWRWDTICLMRFCFSIRLIPLQTLCEHFKRKFLILLPRWLFHVTAMLDISEMSRKDIFSTFSARSWGLDFAVCTMPLCLN